MDPAPTEPAAAHRAMHALLAAGHATCDALRELGRSHAPADGAPPGRAADALLVETLAMIAAGSLGPLPIFSAAPLELAKTLPAASITGLADLEALTRVCPDAGAAGKLQLTDSGAAAAGEGAVSAAMQKHKPSFTKLGYRNVAAFKRSFARALNEIAPDLAAFARVRFWDAAERCLEATVAAFCETTGVAVSARMTCTRGGVGRTWTGPTGVACGAVRYVLVLSVPAGVSRAADGLPGEVRLGLEGAAGRPAYVRAYLGAPVGGAEPLPGYSHLVTSSEVLEFASPDAVAAPRTGTAFPAGASAIARELFLYAKKHAAMAAAEGLPEDPGHTLRLIGAQEDLQDLLERRARAGDILAVQTFGIQRKRLCVLNVAIAELQAAQVSSATAVSDLILSTKARELLDRAASGDAGLASCVRVGECRARSRAAAAAKAVLRAYRRAVRADAQIAVRAAAPRHGPVS